MFAARQVARTRTDCFLSHDMDALDRTTSSGTAYAITPILHAAPAGATV